MARGMVVNTAIRPGYASFLPFGNGHFAATGVQKTQCGYEQNSGDSRKRVFPDWFSKLPIAGQIFDPAKLAFPTSLAVRGCRQGDRAGS